MQLDQDERGFSFQKEGPLDMRMNRKAELTAADVVNNYPETDLGKIFRDLGEEPRWKGAAKAVVRARRKKRFTTTKELADVVSEEIKVKRRGKLHPATLVFQALRIYVNNELESIQQGVTDALKRLSVGGRIGVISFHSFEDRLVKNLFRDATKPNEWMPLVKNLTKKPVVAERSEVRMNRRSRSAKLRVAQRVE